MIIKLLLFTQNTAVYSHVCITPHPQQFSHMVFIVLNYIRHYSHRDNDDVEDLPAKRQRLQGKQTTNKKD